MVRGTVNPHTWVLGVVGGGKGAAGVGEEKVMRGVRGV